MFSNTESVLDSLTIIFHSLEGQISASECLSADGIFMFTSQLCGCLTLSRVCDFGHLISKMCVGVQLPWTVKGADAVLLSVCVVALCMCVPLVRTCACSLTYIHMDMI